MADQRYIPEFWRELADTVQALSAPGRGIVALDESNATCTKRFEAVGAESTPETRRQYRCLLLGTPGIGEHISGAILYDETLRQADDEGTPLPRMMAAAGVVPGIKVDTGAKALAGAPGEQVTEGLDGLRERLQEYRQLGARFAKWRAVIRIGEGLPSRACVNANAHALARYSALCQEAGLVPIVEPEVLLDGDHDLERCEQVTEEVLRTVFQQLCEQNVLLEGTILKSSMVVPGKASGQQVPAETVADRTVVTLLRSVPAALGAVVFLSGGQSERQATMHLDAMNRRWAERVPWRLTFSYARALQQPALEIWRGDPARSAEAQQAFARRARLNGLASEGCYDPAMDDAA